MLAGLGGCAGDGSDLGGADASLSSPVTIEPQSPSARARLHAIATRFAVHAPAAAPGDAPAPEPRVELVLAPPSDEGRFEIEPDSAGRIDTSHASSPGSPPSGPAGAVRDPAGAPPLRAVVPGHAARAADVRLPRSSAAPFRVTDATSGLFIDVRLAGATDVPVEVAGGHALYRGALAGADVVHRVTPAGTEDFLHFERAPERTMVEYEVALSDDVAGVRAVGGSVEFLDADGAPRLRVAPPWLVDARGRRLAAALSVAGCAVDESPAPPWDRPTVDPSARACTVRVAFGHLEPAYPMLLDPSWTTTGSLATARRGHGGVRLANGRVLVTGGQGAAALASSELYDPATGTWSATGALSAARTELGVVLMASGNVIAAGGWTGAAVSRVVDIYNPATGTWTVTDQLNTGRYRHAMVRMASGDILAIGGLNGANPTNRTEAYRLGTNQWANVDNLNAARSRASAITLPSGLVLATGGEAAGGAALATAEIYNPAGNAWNFTPAMSSTRTGHTMTQLGTGRVLVAGGNTASAELYDPGSNSFTATGAMIVARFGHSANLIPDGRVVIAGGRSGGVESASASIYDPATGTFTTTASLNVARALHVGVTLTDGRVLVAGGEAGGAALASAELFDLSANGQACTGAGDCKSGICVDGVCCNAACGAACDRCNVAGSLGTCTAVPDADPGSPACAPFLCNGVATACPTTCVADVDCATGNYCNGSSQCVPKLGNGSACTANNQCTSTFCVDNFCCNAACGGGCDRCDVAGTVGACTVIAAGSAGANPGCAPYVCGGTAAACPTTCTADTGCAAGNWCNAGGQCVAKLGNGVACTGNNQCTSTFCVDGVCCNAACGGGCDRCDRTGSIGTCSVVPAADPGANPPCAPNLCDGVSPACPGACTNDAQCVAGRYCNGAGACVPKLANGVACATGNQCTSTFCVDGVCCNAACGESCDRCDLMGTVGTCTNLVAGQAGSPSCAPYVCSGAAAACPAACTVDANCATGRYCNAGSQCVPKLADGQACGAANQCQSGFCVDGVCCNAACGGACDRCDVSGFAGTCQVLTAGSAGTPLCAPYVCNGTAVACPATCTADTGCVAGNFCNAMSQCTPKLAIGAACTAANQCTSGFCADGVCCNAACTGSCDRCDQMGTVGTCSVLSASAPGTPACAPYLCSGTSASCPGACLADASCVAGNYCDAANACVPKLAAGAVCTASNQCQSSFCVDGFCCNTACAGACDRCDLQGFVGVCRVLASGGAGTPSCSPFVCDGASAACPGACTTDASCAAGNWCNPLNQCVAKVGNGMACTAANQCQSGFCVDGVCCNLACTGGCDRCDTAGFVGSCRTLGAGATGSNPGCGLFVCDGTNPVCPTSCLNDGACVSAAFCNPMGQCAPKQGGGTPCTAGNQCPSGFCVDGVCCDSACTGACDRCDVAGSVGFCQPVAAGGGGTPSCSPYLCNGAIATCPSTCISDANCAANHYCNAMNQCAPRLIQGVACTGNNQCQSDHCVDGVCCNATCGGGCDRCDVAGSVGVCRPVVGGAAGQNPGCGNFLCDGLGGACPSGCTSSANCVMGTFCNAQNQCVAKLDPGAPCTAASQCLSNFCVDGVCCDSACSGQCAACNLAGLAGTCSPVLGAPAAGRPACTTDGSACGGACNGVNTAMCTYPGASVTCRNASCAAGVATLAATCSGSGSCPAPQTSGCTPFVCGATACLTTCASDVDCATGNYCNAMSRCVARLGLGQACTAATQCQSGFCVDGVCCNAACNAQCASCNVAGAAGTCSAVTGAPVGGRPACTTDGTSCGGRCDGVNLAACSYPGAAVSCRAASCAAGVATLAGACDGQGRCPTQTANCAPYVCGATACLSSCSGDADCTAGTFCNAQSQCVANRTNGSACTLGNQCQSGFCADGVCCGAACTGQCESCNQMGFAGNCLPVTGAPTGGRAPCASDGTACAGRCDGTRRTACTYPANTTPCRNASCSMGTALAAANCDGAGACAATAPHTCAPFVCGATACLASCATDNDCVAGNYCNAQSQCVAKLGNGQACITGNQCASTFCVDGVCCNAACGGQCSACNLAAAPGICLPTAGPPVGGRPACVSDGGVCGGVCNGVNGNACTYPSVAVICRNASCTNGTATLTSRCDGQGLCAEQTQACAPYTCGATSCLSSCVLDADCAPNFSCNPFGQCAAQRPNGTACTADNQCRSGFCTDGVCCNTACTGQCAACNLAGLAGTCAPVLGTPVGGRPACGGDGSSCAGRCDGLNPATCTFTPMNTSCRTPSCMNGVAETPGVCDGAGNCSGTQMTCAPYVCGATSCLTSCGSDAECVMGDYCNALSACVQKRGIGLACAAGRECVSGFCADGVCCNAACTEQCAACNLAGREGTCAPVTGPPVGARAACATDGGVCGGACNGVNAAACTFPGNNLTCSQPSCSNGIASAAATCNGQGACSTPVTTNCAPYACGQIACLIACSGDADCASGQFCSGGRCGPRQLPTGQRCTQNAECQSSFCVDGFCCNVACGGQCSACNLAGLEGTCSKVTGDPVGLRTSCPGTGACKGTCDGSNALECALPGATTVCGPGRCEGSESIAPSTCDGKGACVEGGRTSCANGCLGDGGVCDRPGEVLDLGPDMTLVGSFEGGCGCEVGGGRARGTGGPGGGLALGAAAALALLAARRRRAGGGGRA